MVESSKMKIPNVGRVMAPDFGQVTRHSLQTGCQGHDLCGRIQPFQLKSVLECSQVCSQAEMLLDQKHKLEHSQQHSLFGPKAETTNCWSLAVPAALGYTHAPDHGMKMGGNALARHPRTWPTLTGVNAGPEEGRQRGRSV